MQRLDLPALVTAEVEFVHNVRVPGMLHGRVVRPPTIGAKLQSVAEDSVRELPGNVRVVVKNDFVGVVADREWQALRGRRGAAGDVVGRPRAARPKRSLCVPSQSAEP